MRPQDHTAHIGQSNQGLIKSLKILKTHKMMLQSFKFHTNITHRFFNKINIYSYHLIYILISIQQFFMFKRIFSIYFKKKCS